MELIELVHAACKRLVDSEPAWRDLLLKHGLDIRKSTAKALAAELAKPLQIDRGFPGFEDFSAEGQRGIEPRSPARSLLYHALASPNVLAGANGIRLRTFPTPAELEAVENYVFGVEPPTIKDLLKQTGEKALAIVVFAYEYRMALETCHRRHADMTYARTGIARVGTAAARYVPAWRGFTPDSDADPFQFCVSPARYAAYLAVRRHGDESLFRPMRFQPTDRKKKHLGDDRHWFWLPVHKLFSGDECIRGINLEVRLSCYHVNEKIYRIHKVLKQGPSTSWPYRITDHIAAFSPQPEHGTGLLVPEPHERLVEPAILPDGKPLTFRVPPGNTFFSSYEFGDRSAPEYVHVRSEIREGQLINLNDLPEQKLMSKIAAGKYDALHYLDFTGEGWVSAECPQLQGKGGVAAKSLPAYSLVTAPDFFPSCDQRQLTEWTGSVGVPPELRKQIWNVEPETLCDMRLPANLQLPPTSPFLATDTTMTAVVGLDGPRPPGPPLVSPESLRHSHLPDDAAGVFAPGWDVGEDSKSVTGKERTKHLAAYRLGSPFPEDSKLCAALSTFWPAVAPDATREMEPIIGSQSGTVSPLTDQEIGQIGTMPWDGVTGPQVVVDGGDEFAEYASFQHVDYVRNALAGKFTLRQTARVDAAEYERRVLAMAFAYLVLGAERTGNHATPMVLWDSDKETGERQFWKLLSFQITPRGTPELQQAQMEAGIVLPGLEIYRLVLFPVAVTAKGKPTNGPVVAAPNFTRKRIMITTKFFLFVDPAQRLVLVKQQDDPRWRKGTLLLG
jgi:hypothetical protein